MDIVKNSRDVGTAYKERTNDERRTRLFPALDNIYCKFLFPKRLFQGN